MDNIFISYSRSDKEIVDRLISQLEEAGLPLWVDRKDIGGGHLRHEEIVQAIQTCSAFILVLSPSSVVSDNVRRELDLAVENEVPILPVMLKPTELTNAMKYQLTGLQYIYLFDEYQVGVRSLMRSLDDIGRLSMQKRSPVTPSINLRSIPQTMHNAVTEILRILKDNHTAFIAQCRRRDDLVDMLERRLQIHIDLEYEKFFFRYFSQLSSEERFEFDQIRAITEALHNGNQRIMQILDEHPELLDEIPELTNLRQHLNIWLNKFDKVFVNNKAMCLNYTGVEDGVPFPTDIDNKLTKWLKKKLTSFKEKPHTT
jgi:hypothetical protein